MKRWIASMMVFLIAAVFITAIPTSALAADDLIVSPWAKEEIERAQALGFVPELFEEYGTLDAARLKDYTVPITREQFVEVAVDFVAFQQHCDSYTFHEMAKKYLVQMGDDYRYSIKKVFLDGNDTASLAYYLGLVKGKGEGKFDPKALTTRQEAAVILARAYEICGGTISEDMADALRFTDNEKIADWAKESVSAMASLNVMRDIGDGSFAPADDLTVEQCIVSFLRLYENAPVSRKNDNVKPLLTYEQGIEHVITRSDSQHIRNMIHGPAATFIRMDLHGMLRAGSSLWFVYLDGGVQHLPPAAVNKQWGLTPAQELEDLRFSEDGRLFYYTATIKEDVIGYGDGEENLTEKGIYHVTVDVDTCKYWVSKEELPE
ncbi:MAG TPA: S-layer homology domain-containing protein [Clostridiales bacterium]|jgi:hypothetical protein|nr:S-layer homology domain-containing protein [Clostridiales bacterium]